MSLGMCLDARASCVVEIFIRSSLGGVRCKQGSFARAILDGLSRDVES